ncbi:DUF4272 domain-containing protein [Janthinobacterium sp. FT14W]|uniref:DUF4272 domain-containing protein n=1 Tax=Janthinobacterium sp. FT14W TaxID=2654253 RepID=UPI0012650A37|nr:DUF4272 domain-containing protein [Janthinobacterium sp. FT14W]KAB8051896.1 DUF4272 domain-containing protein [Janthinobacterium sp. FT14W]
MKTIPSDVARARLDRSLLHLAALGLPLPVAQLPLPPTLSGAVRSARDTAGRAICLCMCASRAEGLAPEVASDLIADLGASSALLPFEAAFLDPQTDPLPRGPVFQWGFEACWVLLWALGKAGSLETPAATCDPQRIAAMITGAGSIDALAGALRGDAELLDALDLNTRLLALCQQARFVNVPGGLIGQVVAQRQFALLWLLDPAAAPWDEIEVLV